jgi:hypothetical protein
MHHCIPWLHEAGKGLRAADVCLNVRSQLGYRFRRSKPARHAQHLTAAAAQLRHELAPEKSSCSDHHDPVVTVLPFIGALSNHFDLFVEKCLTNQVMSKIFG